MKPMGTVPMKSECCIICQSMTSLVQPVTNLLMTQSCSEDLWIHGVSRDDHGREGNKEQDVDHQVDHPNSSECDMGRLPGHQEEQHRRYATAYPIT